MKYAKIWMFVSLAVLLVVAVSACSHIPFTKSTTKADLKTAAPTPSPAAPVEWKERTWESYADDRGGVTYFYEKESITYPAKNIIHIWRKRTMPGSARGLKEITSYDEIDCRNERFRTIELQGVNPDGTKTEIFRKPSPWSTIYQESADDVILSKFCGEAAKAGGSGKK